MSAYDFDFRTSFLMEQRLAFATMSRTETRRSCDRAEKCADAALGCWLKGWGGWRDVWMAVKHTFLAEWYRATGATYTVTIGNPRAHAVLTGLTS